ncbi:MAG: sialate O-acetylesterase [candidate division KSB1 bacterium]|nr:sialate O-acetylesterase [candidate division KSB1 bacterium]
MEKIRVMVDWDTTIYATTGLRTAKWSVKIKTPAAGGPYQIIINGYNVVVLEDVMIGEVWLCSGQSNMEWSGAHGLPQSLEEAPHATNPNLRLFNITKATSDYPQEDCHASWRVCNPEDMKHFSAVGYFFGKKLHEELKVPVGLINASWGGTPAEVWTPKELVENDPVLKEAATKVSQSVPYWPIIPGQSFNAMISPITNFQIAGAIWYQGESNVGTWSTYQALFTTMIGAWRKAWQRDFPFYYVQIAPWSGYGENNACAFLREAQTKSLSYPNTGMVVVSDLVDDITNIHPKNKRDVALRLANLALAETYGKAGIVYKSPMYKSMKVEGDKIRIYFDHAEAGLMSKGGDPTEFYIAGADKNFQPAIAKIEGNTVVVWNKSVKKPVAVRFGFSNAAMPNLFSKEGLPVNLFRTDDWPAVTYDVKK